MRKSSLTFWLAVLLTLSIGVNYYLYKELQSPTGDTPIMAFEMKSPVTGAPCTPLLDLIYEELEPSEGGVVTFHVHRERVTNSMDVVYEILAEQSLEVTKVGRSFNYFFSRNGE